MGSGGKRNPQRILRLKSCNFLNFIGSGAGRGEAEEPERSDGNRLYGSIADKKAVGSKSITAFYDNKKSRNLLRSRLLFLFGSGGWTFWLKNRNCFIFCIFRLFNNLQLKICSHIVGNLWELFLLPMLQNSTALSTFQAIKNNRQPLSVQLYLSCRSPSDAYKL